MRTKTQILKTASTLKSFSGKLKSAQDETLTPETVKEIAEEIMDVVEVAEELAEEIADNVPAEESRDALGERDERAEQIEVAQDETEEEKKKRMEREAQDKDKDEDKEKIKNLEAKLASMERKTRLAELAPTYANLFPKQMHEAKMNEILQSKEPLSIVENTVKVASDIIQNKTMVKIASMTDSVFDITDSSEEVNIASKL